FHVHITDKFTRVLISSTYLGADIIAIYALGGLSRQEGNPQSIAFFWAPFLLIHLGGQDTITAFKMEANILIKDDEVVEPKEDKISTENDEAIQSTGNNTPIEGDEEVQLEGDEISIENRKAELEKIIIETIIKPKLSLVQLQLGMMYDDLYTKALLLRKKGGIALRFIAISTSIVAFALFLSTEKRRYSKADIAVTMSLFIGELLLEVCAVLIFMMSPWTWAWLKVRKYNWLACFSWHLFSSRIGWPENRPRWSNSMGQYNCVKRLVGISPPTPCTPKIMTYLRNIANKIGAKEISWINKLIHTGYVKADRDTMERVVFGLYGLMNEVDGQDTDIGSFLEQIQDVLTADFGTALLMMHMVTEVFLRQYPGNHSLVDVCRKLSNYMIYLLVNHPSMLPLNTSAISSIKTVERMFRRRTNDISDVEHHKNIHDSLLVGDQPEGDGVLDKLVEMWVRVLLYSAGKSRAELHVEQLASGGELITFAWLLMDKNDYGDSRMKRIQITNFRPRDESYDCYDLPMKEGHAFHIVHRSEVDIQRD
uniref:DUF4220 domain-containing protein n=1 Tax=Oryza glaberrima TaxID=4538 RepID=I1NMU5_ORYGL